MRTVIRGLVMVLVLASPLAVVVPYGADAQEKKQKGKAVFEVFMDKGSDFRFRLKDADGDVLAIASKGYDKKSDILQVIEAIKKEAAKAIVEDKTK
jgi:uncharacterized protein YegP (UPF0339 family)